AIFAEGLMMTRSLREKILIPYLLEGCAYMIAAAALGEPPSLQHRVPASNAADFLRAARLFGAAEAAREAVATPLPPQWRAYCLRIIASVRAALGDQSATTAWAAGRAMTLEQAVEYALEPV